MKNEDDRESGVSIGIKVKIGGHETTCPITGIYRSYEALASEVASLKEDFEEILKISKGILGHSAQAGALDLRSDMRPEEIWESLSSVNDVDLFVESFNAMDEEKRKEVADYILTRCNIFSGMGSVFSARYDNETGLLE